MDMVCREQDGKGGESEVESDFLPHSLGLTGHLASFPFLGFLHLCKRAPHLLFSFVFLRSVFREDPGKIRAVAGRLEEGKEREDVFLLWFVSLL